MVAGWSFTGLIRRASALGHARSQAVAELSTANAALTRELADAPDLVLAEERGRVARALHDSLGHRLTAIGPSLDFAERVWPTAPERVREEVGVARRTTTEALDDMRAAVRAMHPVQLPGSDLCSALGSLSQSFATTGLAVTVRHTDGIRLDGGGRAPPASRRPGGADQRRPVLRRDLLHARRRRLWRTGFGLRSLRERAAVLGEDLHVAPHGGIDGGLRLTITLPPTGEEADR